MTMSTGNASCEAQGWVGEPPEQFPDPFAEEVVVDDPGDCDE